MKKLILCALISSTAYAQENPYEGIPQRNAFDLTSETAKPILPPVAEILRPTVFLTGITHHQTIYQAHLVSRSSSPLSSRFLSLSPGEQKDNIKVIKITKSSVVISNNGSKELLTFKDNGLPTVRLSSSSEKRSSSGKSEKRSRPSSKDSKSQSPTPPTPPTSNRHCTLS